MGFEVIREKCLIRWWGDEVEVFVGIGIGLVLCDPMRILIEFSNACILLYVLLYH